jgi:hypothetical protein
MRSFPRLCVAVVAVNHPPRRPAKSLLNEDPNNFRIMINGFLNSTEYRLRFGQP